MNKRGVSLISLVITIIVILILAAISFNAINVMDQASEAKIMQELSEVRKGMLVVRTINSKVDIDEETLNKGFTKVNIENPPENFVSFDNDKYTGYVVNLATIDYDKSKAGQSYTSISSGDTVVFDETDVYVYDAALKVFYVKNGKYIEAYDGSVDDNSSTNKRLNGPTISVSVGTNGKLDITVNSSYGGAILSVLVDGQKATTSDGVHYEFVVSGKDSCTIMATEENAGTTTKVVKLQGNDEEEDVDSPEIISYICNYKQGSAEVLVTAQSKNAKIAYYAVTVGEDSMPSSDSWVAISQPSSMYTTKFDVTENGVYTVWVKNNFGKIGNASKNIRVLLNVTYKYEVNGGEAINITETTRQVGCNSLVDLSPKVTRAHYEFLGWNTKATATEGLTEYNIGTENDVVLYPIFKEMIKVVKPSVVSYIYTYNGKIQELLLNNFDNIALKITGNTMIDVGTKTAKIQIMNKERYEWEDGTNDDLYFTWTINKKVVSAIWETTRQFVYNGNEQAPTVSANSGVDGETLNLVRTTGVNTGTYTSVAQIDSVTGGQGKVTNYELNNNSVSFEIKNASMSGKVTITGNNIYPNTLTVDTSEIVPTGATLSYQWYSNSSNSVSGGSLISGATSSSYTLQKNLIGKYIYVVVTATKNNYNKGNFTDITDSTNNINEITACNHSYKDATCTVAKTCTICGATSGSALGHDYKAATCTTPKTCTRCGGTSGSALGHQEYYSDNTTRNRLISEATCTTAEQRMTMCIRCGVDIRQYSVSGPLNHSYREATCTLPKTCERCGATTGSALGHSYSDATCTTPKTCTRCGGTGGGALGHSYSAATCTLPKTCTRCGTTSGSALGHSYSDATCTTPKTCTRCGGTGGGALGHSYSAATCTAPKTCTRCGATSGSALGHSYGSATCTWASACSRCGTTTGSALGHNWKSATCTSPKKCSRCGTTTGSSLGHNYSGWSSNAQSHWKACTRGCGTNSSAGTHYNNGTLYCGVCGRKISSSTSVN